MTSPNPSQPDPAERRARSISLAVTIVLTIAITLALTLASAFFGGFGSRGAGGASEGAAREISLAIQIHLATAIPALLLGPVVLLRRKGDNLHRFLGRIWVALMLITAIASAFIRTPGAGIAGTGYSFIHIFTIWTFINAPIGVWLARKGRIRAHRGAMTGLYAGLVIAGSFTLIPGRLIGNLVFG